MCSDQKITAFESDTSAAPDPLKVRELDLKEREIAVKEREVKQSKWTNPLLVGLLAAAVGLLGNAWVAYLNNQATQKLEQLREKSNLIVEVVKTGNPDDACKNLNFLVKMNLVDDPTGAISNCKENPTDTPVLPSQASGTDWLQGLSFKPGTERWPVKTGSDADAAGVGDKQYVDAQGLHMDQDGSVHTTVEYLVGLPRPAQLPATEDPIQFQNRRLGPVEFISWTVEGTLIALKVELDGDYHMVIQGASGTTLVAEIPDPVSPFIDPKSRWAQQIAAARKSVDDRMLPQLRAGKMSMPVRITGVGFFDRAHGATGSAPNVIELHPVTHVDFMQ